MKIKHQDIEIPEGKPFENCKLARQPYAVVLTNIVSTYADGFVLAINNEWGTGKTTFVKMWQQHLKNLEFKTLYFNAWEDDFENEALAAIMAELSTLQTKDTKVLFQKVLKTGAKLAKGAIPIILKALAAKYLDKEVLAELFGEIVDNANNLLQSQIEEHTSKKQSLKEFKESLSEFIEKAKDDKPIIFIIDELDRCRPNYAVEVLEKVKHFFDVPGIIFVLSIDKIQLGHAVRGFYGSENIAAEEYLRRFIDIEYSIPEPSTQRWVTHLFHYFGFQEYFEKNARRNKNEEFDSFIDILNILFKSSSLTLRMGEKIMSHAKLAIDSFGPTFIIPEALVFLIYLRSFHGNLYKDICKMSLSYQELINEIEKIVGSNVEQNSKRKFLYMEAQLLVLYHNSYCRINYDSKLYETTSDNPDSKFLVSSSFRGENLQRLESFVNHIQSHKEYSDATIDHLISRIDLTKPLKN